MAKDNFSGHSAIYAQYRPSYPDELFNFILKQVKQHEAAWDCGTGNGQTAKKLSMIFRRVEATDISPQQLAHAMQGENIFYSLQPAEQTRFADNSFNLVTISQALHWFDPHLFYPEVNRVMQPGAIIAAWCYSLLKISPAIDQLLQHYHFVTLAPYWDQERRYVDEAYETIPFPYARIASPSFYMRYEWSLSQLEGYLRTWSALPRFISARGYDPVVALMEDIRRCWTGDRLPVLFPLHLLLGKIEK